MWYRFVLAGRKQIEQKFGTAAYQIAQSIQQKLKDAKIVQSIQQKLQEPAAAFAYNLLQNDPTAIEKIKDQIQELFIKTADLVEKKYINVFLENNKVIIKSQTDEHVFNIDDPEAFLKFSEKIDFYKTLLMPVNLKTQTQSENILNIPDGTITVIKANNVVDAIQLGSGTTWCISQPKNTMYQSYRSLKASTFYFVFDTTRPEGDPLRRVVVDITEHGIELTDLNNNTGTISKFGDDDHAYMEYLNSKGVDIGQFKNDPYTKKEKEEYEFLTNRAYNLDDFISLGSRAKAKNIDDVYSKYIGFGNMLSSDQLKFLINSNAKYLVDQYLNTGNPIHKENLSLLNNQQTRTYLRRRNMMYDYYKDQYVGYDNQFKVYQFLDNVHDDQFIDEVFFDRLMKEGESIPALLKKHVELNYKYNGYDSLIDRLLNENLTQYELKLITKSLLYSNNVEILDKFLNLHPDQIKFMEEAIPSMLYVGSNIKNYLYHKMKNPKLFVEPAAKDIVYRRNYKGDYIDNLIDDGYVDELMKSILSWPYNLSPQIDYLLSRGASLENAWYIASTQYGVTKHNQDHIYRLMKEKHPEYIEEWMKEENPTLRPKFESVPAEELGPPETKETQSFNAIKYYKLGAKYVV